MALVLVWSQAAAPLPVTRACARRASAAAASRGAPAIVLVTLDGAIAADVFDGARLPNLRRLIDRGVALGGAAAPMVASGPRFVSLPGYREIVTGRRGAGCTDNECPPIGEPTLSTSCASDRVADADDVAVIASWEVIARAASIAPSTLALSAGRHGGARRAALAVTDAARVDLDRGARASAWPGHGDYRPDALTAALALDVVAARHPRLLWVALGDTDEYAHRGDRDGYLAALADADRFLGKPRRRRRPRRRRHRRHRRSRARRQLPRPRRRARVERGLARRCRRRRAAPRLSAHGVAPSPGRHRTDAARALALARRRVAAPRPADRRAARPDGAVRRPALSDREPARRSHPDVKS